MLPARGNPADAGRFLAARSSIHAAGQQRPARRRRDGWLSRIRRTRRRSVWQMHRLAGAFTNAPRTIARARAQSPDPMINNDVLRSIRCMLDLSDIKVVEIARPVDPVFPIEKARLGSKDWEGPRSGGQERDTKSTKSGTPLTFPRLSYGNPEPSSKRGNTLRPPRTGHPQFIQGRAGLNRLGYLEGNLICGCPGSCARFLWVRKNAAPGGVPGAVETQGWKNRGRILND